MRRSESPVRRRNPSGAIRWVARYTNADGKRVSAGAFEKKGPCKRPGTNCCATHAIWAAYEAEPEPGALTVGGWYSVWLDRFPRGERTEANYRGRVKAVLDVDVDGRKFRDWPIREVERPQLMRLVDVMLREHGRAASGARAIVAVLSAMFENAIDAGELGANPAKGVRLRSNDPRVQKAARKVTVASWQEMHAFAAASCRPAMVRVLSDCGLRLGEMLALECKHVRGDVLIVEQSAWHCQVTPGTKQSARREVPIPPELSRILAREAKDRIGLLFATPAGRCWTERSFYRVVWYPAQEASGLGLRPHDMRHSYVSLMRAAGVDPGNLATWTGHTTMTATRVYTHGTGASMEMARRAVG